MSLRVGIVGCGGIAELHARGYRAAEGAELVACADLNGERARTFAAKHEIARAYESLEAMLDNERLDGISVCTPNYAHCDLTVAALSQGIGVLCEKPIAMNSEEALRMVEASRLSGAPLTIGHNLRFTPAARFLKRRIEEGELGRIYFGRSHALRRRGVPGWGEFHLKNKSGGGPLIDIGVHALDLIIWLMGSPEPRSVSGSVYTKFGNRADFYTPWGNTYRREDYDVEDFACGLIKFADGISLMLEASWAGHLPEEETAPQVILGDQGGARLMTFGLTPGAPSLQMFTAKEEALVDMTPKGFPDVETHIEEVKHWVRVLQGKCEVLVRPEESLNVQRIMDAIYQSSREGREIVLGDASGESAEPGVAAGRVGSLLELAPA